MSSLDWLPAAQALPEGRTRKVEHDCGPGECLQINHKREGYAAYCHRCGYKWFCPRAAESLADRLERLAKVKGAEDEAEGRPWLPMPSEPDPSEWPMAARVWLYKAGLSNVDISRLGIYWNPTLERVVIPIRDDSGELLYWQARTLDPTNPRKYLNPAVDKRRLVAKFRPPVAVTGELVLTEDLLSAYRVSRAGFEAWSLLGTKLNERIAAEVVRGRRSVVTWLDPDGAGQRGADEIRRHFRAYCVPVRNIVSERDPKLLTRGEIIALIT